jgi:hypothetical protein
MQEFIQMRYTSDETITTELTNIVTARTVEDIERAIKGNQVFWDSVLKPISEHRYTHLSERFADFKHTSNYSYLNIKSALNFIQFFAEDNPLYGNSEQQARKFKTFLSSLTYMEANLILLLLVRQGGKIELIRQYYESLNPVKPVANITDIEFDQIQDEPELVETEEAPDQPAKRVRRKKNE